jgi:hypothetical protein
VAGFNWFTCEIDMTSRVGGYHGSKADLATIPGNAGPTMSFSHEYVHFLQLIGSLVGFNLLAELLDFGVRAALKLAKITKPGQKFVSGYYHILDLLRHIASGEGQKDPDIRERARLIMDEGKALFLPHEFPYTGDKGPWELDIATSTVGTYTEPFWGFVTERKTWRPITPGMLAEGIARRIDQWIKQNHAFHGHSWDDSSTEREVYNGIRGLLSQRRYDHNISPATIDQITVSFCWLALATPRPDLAAAVMFDRLEHGATAGGTSAMVALTLQDVLKTDEEQLLSAGHYNAAMGNVQHGATILINRVDYLAIYRQLQNIHRVGGLVMNHPGCFSDPAVKWGQVRSWMQNFSVPKVVADDGHVDAIDGIACTPTVTDLMCEIVRVLF